MSALAVWFNLDHSAFLNERFQMKRTKEFKILKERNRTGREKACFVQGYTICDIQAKAENKKETMIKEYFWCKILLTDEKFGSNKSGKKMPQTGFEMLIFLT